MFRKPVPREFKTEVTIKVLQTDRKQRNKLSLAKAIIYQYTENHTDCEEWIERNTNILDNDGEESYIMAGSMYYLLTQHLNEFDVYSSGNRNSGIWDVSSNPCTLNVIFSYLTIIEY